MTILTRSLAVWTFGCLVTFGQTIPLPLPFRAAGVDNQATRETALNAAKASLKQAQDEVDRLTGVKSRGAQVPETTLAKAKANLQKAQDTVDKVTSEAIQALGSACWWLPTRPYCVEAHRANLQTQAKTGTTVSYDDAVNGILGTTGKFTAFNQIQSIYNGASGSATLSSDLGTLNFDSGLQVALVTNAQAGSAGASSPSTGAVPTLAAAGAGQAVQNVLYGGTFLVEARVPLILAVRGSADDKDGIILNVDWVSRGGVDIQNFKSGTNVNTTSPPVHGSSQLQAYFQYNSTHPVTDPTGANFTGAVFLGGSYGYDYMSHGYARDYGFGNNVSNAIGQASLGVMINNVVKVAFSRAFGPSQIYMDSTTMLPATVNNFKSWSLGVSYQQAAAPASK